ncbi:MAG: hypothetical protein J6W19_01575 [Prevotella sp.]|nr:hypothetical protein [Prevotella sp.]
MKQKIFMLLAAVLVSSVSVFAQSGNIVKLKGDVNGDGKVDVADISNVIDIMAGGEPGYFYFGTTKPTTENYRSMTGVVGDYTSIAEAYGTTANVTAGKTLYMLCPASWTDGKNVTMEDEKGNSYNFIEDFDAVTISGYAIYKTQVWGAAATVTLKTTQYWYVGPSTPTSVDTSDIKTSAAEIGWHIFTPGTTSLHVGELSNDTKVYWVVLVPASSGLKNVTDYGEILGGYTNSTVTINGVSYTKIVQDNATKKFDYIITI